VEEMGYFGWNQSLMAKEVLAEPIIVQNDSYFKLSFTYKVKNPHENREVNRIREIRYGGKFSSVSINSTQNQSKIFPSKKKNVIVITLTSETYSKEEDFTSKELEFSGWTKIQDSTIIIPLGDATLTKKQYARIDFFKPDLTTEDNYIQEEEIVC
jgi:hypothetical protein